MVQTTCHTFVSHFEPLNQQTHTPVNPIPNQMVHTLCTPGKFRSVLFAAIQLYYLNRSVSKILGSFVAVLLNIRLVFGTSRKTK